MEGIPWTRTAVPVALIRKMTRSSRPELTTRTMLHFHLQSIVEEVEELPNDQRDRILTKYTVQRLHNLDYRMNNRSIKLLDNGLSKDLKDLTRYLKDRIREAEEETYATQIRQRDFRCRILSYLILVTITVTGICVLSGVFIYICYHLR